MSQLPWFVARSTGVFAWILLTASALWGLSISSKAALGRRRDGKPRRPHPAWQLDLHRYLGGLATIFVLVHIAAVIADSYVHFTLRAVLVPFVSTWRPAAIAWGIAAMYLLVAVELSSLAKKHLPKSAWRAIHFASFPLFLTATVHGYTAGTDTRTWLAQSTIAVAVAAVAGMTAYRIQHTKNAATQPSRVATQRRTPPPGLAVAPPRPRVPAAVGDPVPRRRERPLVAERGAARETASVR